MTKDNPFIRDMFSNGGDQEVELQLGQYLYFRASDGTCFKVEMINGELHIWNQGNTANFSLSVQPVSSNVVKIVPTR